MKRFENHPDELISASLAGDLTDLERRELDAHLATCPTCRETLESFSQQRQLLAGLPVSRAPRDLAARVRTGIESRRFAMPWYRRPGRWLAGVASVATVAVAALLTFAILNGRGSPTAQTSTSPSPSPAVSATTSASPSPIPSTAALPLNLRPGDLIYTQLTGPFDHPKLTVSDAQRGTNVQLADPTSSQFGEPKRAALSPDGRLLAFATETGAKGTWRIFVANLADGSTQQLAETWPLAFGRRIAWSPDGRYLGFTVASVEAGGTSDVWLYDRASGSAKKLTNAGNAYFASWGPQNAGNEQLWVSLGAANPVSQLAQFFPGGIPSDPLAGEATTVGGVFAPLVSSDGAHALYWTGTMSRDGTNGWIFSRGGMPQLTSMDGNWKGTPLFSDLSIPQDGQAFSSGELSWADDGDAYAVWGGNWTGTPEGSGYPDPNAVYVGGILKGQLSQSSALDLGTMTSSSGDALYLVGVALSTDGSTAAVTLGIPLPGDLVAPRSYLRMITVAGGTPTDVGSGGLNPPPWSGPGIIVPELLGP